MRDIVEGIADALGKHPFPVRVPASPALFLSRLLSNLGTRSQFLAKLGHVPRLPRMAGLHQTVQKWLAEDVYDTRRFEEAYRFQTKTSLED